MGLSFTGKVEKNPLIQEGDYEVTLNAEWAQTKMGDDYIKITYEIRKDVEQNEQGRLVFDGLYKSKKTGDYPSNKIEAILSTIPAAEQKLTFEDYDEFIQYINGLNMIITVQTEKADPTNSASVDKSICKYLSNKPTVAGPTFANKGPVEDTTVQAGELPF